MRAWSLNAIRSIWGRLAVAGAAVGACAIAAAASHGAPAAGDVLSVRFGGDQHETRVVIELNQAAKGRVLDQDGADRSVAVALPDLSVPADMSGHGQGLVSDWSVDSAAGAARIRLQLTRPAQIRRRFLLAPADGVSVYRYVIDLSAGDAAPNAAHSATSPGVASAPALAGARLTPVSNVAPLRLKKVIVIDAGHGGKDPGAAGAFSREKDINLAAAMALKGALERSGHYRVVMTRSTDTYVPLETRVEIARRAHADLFISLHSDSGPQADMRGATVYTLSDKGSDRVVRNVMGSSDWFINVDLPGRDRAVNQILLDLTQRNTRNRSAAFAEGVLAHIADCVVLQRRSHRDAGFMVLLAPDVPAVLLEMGYITNPDDEASLNDSGKRERFMDAVAASIDGYFGQQTEIAAR